MRTSRRLRRLTTARPRLGLVLGLERPSHIAGTFLAMRRFYYDPAKYRTYLEQLGIAYPTVRAADGSCPGGATP